VFPSWATPLIVGSAVFCGAGIGAATVEVALEVADAEPALFDAVTTILRADPTSAATAV
jgi:hypothetical protein